jgi:hypothetical protein
MGCALVVPMSFKTFEEGNGIECSVTLDDQKLQVTVGNILCMKSQHISTSALSKKNNPKLLPEPGKINVYVAGTLAILFIH